MLNGMPDDGADRRRRPAQKLPLNDSELKAADRSRAPAPLEWQPRLGPARALGRARDPHKTSTESLRPGRAPQPRRRSAPPHRATGMPSARPARPLKALLCAFVADLAVAAFRVAGRRAGMGGPRHVPSCEFARRRGAAARHHVTRVNHNWARAETRAGGSDCASHGTHAGVRIESRPGVESGSAISESNKLQALL